MALKIIFMGTPNFAVPILKAIHKSDHKILEVYTQPPKKKDRGQKIQNSPVHNFAKKKNIKVRLPNLLDKQDEIDHIRILNPDIIIVAAYGKILPTNLLDMNSILFLNVHASLLPRWRGAAPIQRAIMNMDNETGISIMKIVSKLDAGPVSLQSKIKIDKDTTFIELSEKMSKLGSELILKALKLIENNKIEFTNQKESDVTYANKIQKIESKINWNESASKIIAKINALYPSPGCWFSFLGNRIKIVKAKEINYKANPGKIVDKNFTIACLKNAVQILELQKEGKKEMTTEEFLRGNEIEVGYQLT